MENKKEWKIKWPKNIPKEMGSHILRKDRIVILLLIGVLLLVIAIPVPKSATQEKTVTTTEKEKAGEIGNQNEYSAYIEAHLEEALSQVEGVGQVKAMVTLKTSAEKIVEKDKESMAETISEEDSQGGTRATTSRTDTEAAIYENEKQTPYVTKEVSPQVEGIMIIAAGGDNAVVARNITEAVQALFDIDTHKIKIMKLNKK